VGALVNDMPPEIEVEVVKNVNTMLKALAINKKKECC
jgi:hypothetical protein